MYMSGNKTYTSLTPSVVYILLALADEEKHGYAIMKQVEVDSQGKYSFGPGTLYGTLKRLLEAGMVAESNKMIDPAMDDQRRIYYKITGIGQDALQDEIKRYKRVATLTRRRTKLANGS